MGPPWKTHKGTSNRLGLGCLLSTSQIFLAAYSDLSPPHPWVPLGWGSATPPPSTCGFLKPLPTLPLSFRVFVATSKLQPLLYPHLSHHPLSLAFRLPLSLFPLTPNGALGASPPSPSVTKFRPFTRPPQSICSLSPLPHCMSCQPAPHSTAHPTPCLRPGFESQSRAVWPSSCLGFLICKAELPRVPWLLLPRVALRQSESAGVV